MVILCSALWVKQRCLSEDFIASNDNIKMIARGLYAKLNGGERELASGETEKESVWETEHRRKREVASVQRSSYLHKHKEEMKCDKKDNYADKDIAATIPTAHLFYS